MKEILTTIWTAPEKLDRQAKDNELDSILYIIQIRCFEWYADS